MPLSGGDPVAKTTQRPSIQEAAKALAATCPPLTQAQLDQIAVNLRPRIGGE